MQSYPFNLNAGNGFATIINAAGDLFVYVKGTTTGDSNMMSVKSDTGGEVNVIPGQRFRLPQSGNAMPTRWTLRSKDGVSPIMGELVIGAGDFDDANTLNVMKLDASFANTVTVTNDNAAAIPIKAPVALPVKPEGASLPVNLVGSQVKINNTTAERVPVSLDPGQTFNSSAPIMAYTHAAKILVTSGTAGPIITPGANANGIIIEQVICSNSGGQLLSKASQPGAALDGDVLIFNIPGGVENANRKKINAGKGAYIWWGGGGQMDFHVLYTVL